MLNWLLRIASGVAAVVIGGIILQWILRNLHDRVTKRRAYWVICGILLIVSLATLICFIVNRPPRVLLENPISDVKKLVVEITGPADGDMVGWRTLIEGKVSDLDAVVWVVVHAMEAGQYSVQPKIDVRPGGTWKVMAFFGRPGDIDIGREYEVLAVANPESYLREGDVMSDWPSTSARSQVIGVTRR